MVVSITSKKFVSEMRNDKKMNIPGAKRRQCLTSLFCFFLFAGGGNMVLGVVKVTVGNESYGVVLAVA